jgi:hypothetical protein
MRFVAYGGSVPGRRNGDAGIESPAKQWYGADLPRIIELVAPQKGIRVLSIVTCHLVGKEGRMPLSDHEQRMLDQIESALYAEDPKFASSVRGGGLRAPTARRRLQGVALFVIGLAMLVSGVAFKTMWIGSFPVLSVFGFLVMFGGVVFAITGPRLSGRVDHPGSAAGPSRQRRSKGSGSFTSRMEDRFRRRFDE